MTAEGLAAATLLAAASYLAVRNQRRWRLAVAAGVLLVSGAVLSQLAPPPPHDESAVTQRAIRVDSDGYVGSEACRSCHPAEYSTWRRSYHSTMTQLPTRESIRAPMPQQPLHYQGWTATMRSRGDGFVAELWGPDTLTAYGVERIELPVVLVTGSHNYQVYWLQAPEPNAAAAPGRLNSELPEHRLNSGMRIFPFVYRIDDGAWIPRTATHLRSHTPAQAETARWSATCLKCHSTHGVTVPTQDSAHAEVAEFGISCEECHGPGGEHARTSRDPLHRYGAHRRDETDSDMVNPAELTPKQQSEVCGRCHSVFYNDSEESYRAFLGEGVAFRPGDTLEQAGMFVVRYPEHLNHPWANAWNQEEPHFFRNRFWSDGMIRMTGREYNGVTRSPCYEDAPDDSKMSCLSCHALHKPADDPAALDAWADDQLKPGMRGNRACTQCHDKYSTPEAVSAHSHHAGGIESANQCQNCHSPYTTYGLLRAMRNHQVSSPDVRSSVETGRPNACNLCHLDKTLAWSAQHLEQWYQIERPALSGDQQQVAASVLWTLQGDAAQRALMAWGFGWEPARDASGSEWMVPYLAQLVGDGHAATRWIARRVLRRQPGLKDLDYDVLGDDETRLAADVRALYARWLQQTRGGAMKGRTQLLFDHAGDLDRARYDRLIAARDHAPIQVAE